MGMIEELLESIAGGHAAETPMLARAMSGLLGNASGGGMAQVLDRLRAGGLGPQVDSWVGQGPNLPVDAGQLHHALGDEALDRMVGVTGMSREDLSAKLSQHLPGVVDRLTPQGRLPEGGVQV